VSNFSLIISSSWKSGRREGSRWLLRESTWKKAIEGKLCCSVSSRVKRRVGSEGLMLFVLFNFCLFIKKM